MVMNASVSKNIYIGVSFQQKMSRSFMLTEIEINSFYECVVLGYILV